MTDAQTDCAMLEIPFAIPADWTQDQARAVADLLQDLTMVIMSHYQLYDFDEPWEKQEDIDGAPPANIEPTTLLDDELPF